MALNLILSNKDSHGTPKHRRVPEVLKLQAAIMRDTHVPLPDANCEEISLNVIIRNGKIAFVRNRYHRFQVSTDLFIHSSTRPRR